MSDASTGACPEQPQGRAPSDPGIGSYSGSTVIVDIRLPSFKPQTASNRLKLSIQRICYAVGFAPEYQPYSQTCFEVKQLQASNAKTKSTNYYARGFRRARGQAFFCETRDSRVRVTTPILRSAAHAQFEAQHQIGELLAYFFLD